ncbi:hypothetical protein DVH05_020773 [Phytophthora capsici]|nr:hypothetical protein DVH05_020773 [Phytophthora capsici]
MVKVLLPYRVVGQAEGGSVEVDDSVPLWKIKEAILEEEIKKSRGIANLQLFLARTDGGEWLDETDVAALVSDDLEHFTPMDFSLFLKNPKHFGHNFQPKEGHVHVLVVVPPEGPPTKKQRVDDVGLTLSTDGLDAICEFGQKLTREDLATGKLLKTPRIVLRVNLSRGLYVRQEYWDMHAIMTKDLKPGDRVLVIGSPGIGKSVFGVFLLLLFMSERKNVAFQSLRKEEKIFYFTWNRIENRYDVTLRRVPETEYEGLFDGKENGTEWNTLAIVNSYLFASPRRENYNEFVKEGCARVYMNPWTKDECQNYADAVGLEDDEWFTRYSLIGGNPRLLFSSKRTMDDLKYEVSRAIHMGFPKLQWAMRGNEYEEFIHNALFEVYRDVERPSLCFVQFASDTIFNMVCSSFNGEQNDRIRKLLQTTDANLQAWRGRVSERDRRQRDSLETSEAGHTQ